MPDFVWNQPKHILYCLLCASVYVCVCECIATLALVRQTHRPPANKVREKRQDRNVTCLLHFIEYQLPAFFWGFPWDHCPKADIQEGLKHSKIQRKFKKYKQRAGSLQIQTTQLTYSISEVMNKKDPFVWVCTLFFLKNLFSFPLNLLLTLEIVTKSSKLKVYQPFS